MVKITTSQRIALLKISAAEKMRRPGQDAPRVTQEESAASAHRTMRDTYLRLKRAGLLNWNTGGGMSLTDAGREALASGSGQ